MLTFNTYNEFVHSNIFSVTVLFLLLTFMIKIEIHEICMSMNSIWKLSFAIYIYDFNQYRIRFYVSYGITNK